MKNKKNNRKNCHKWLDPKTIACQSFTQPTWPRSTTDSRRL